jgi:hypothetical protein
MLDRIFRIMGESSTISTRSRSSAASSGRQGAASDGSDQAAVFIDAPGRFHNQKMVIIIDGPLWCRGHFNGLETSGLPSQDSVKRFFSDDVHAGGMNDLPINDKYRSLPVILGYPHTKTGSRQAAHLDQVDELNVFQRPGKPTICIRPMIFRSFFGSHVPRVNPFLVAVRN